MLVGAALTNTNTTGKILPKAKAAVVEFMFSLNTKQRDQFRNIVNTGLPKGDASMFAEIGDGGAAKASDLTGVGATRIRNSSVLGNLFCGCRPECKRYLPFKAYDRVRTSVRPQIAALPEAAGRYGDLQIGSKSE